MPRVFLIKKLKALPVRWQCDENGHAEDRLNIESNNHVGPSYKNHHDITSNATRSSVFSFDCLGYTGEQKINPTTQQKDDKRIRKLQEYPATLSKHYTQQSYPTFDLQQKKHSTDSSQPRSHQQQGQQNDQQFNIDSPTLKENNQRNEQLCSITVSKFSEDFYYQQQENQRQHKRLNEHPIQQSVQIIRPSATPFQQNHIELQQKQEQQHISLQGQGGDGQKHFNISATSRQQNDFQAHQKGDEQQHHPSKIENDEEIIPSPITPTNFFPHSFMHPPPSAPPFITPREYNGRFLYSYSYLFPFLPPPSQQSHQKMFLTASEQQKHQCEYCHKWFKRSSSLSNHRMIHKNDKTFKCNQCSMCFLRKSDLGKHMVIHSGSKPYECNVCGKRFSQSSNMLTHQRRHTGVRPYSCNICGKSFYRKVDVRRHESVHK